MTPDRFDALAKTLTRRCSRRTATVAASALALAGLVPLRTGRSGTAQDRATPGATPAASPGPGETPTASPVASPGPLDLVSGSPPAGDDQAELRRQSDCCREWLCEDQSGIVAGSVVLPEYVCPDPGNPIQARQACNSSYPACALGCRAFCSFAPDEEELPGFTPA